MRKSTLFLPLFLIAASLAAQDATYKTPPGVIEEIVMAKPSPRVMFNEESTWMLQLGLSPFYSVSDLAKEELRLAGLRIEPETYSQSRLRGYNKAQLKHVKTMAEVSVTGLPESAIIIGTEWYPAGDKLIFACKEQNGIYLYAASCSDGRAEKLSARRVNACTGIDFHWLNDTDFLVAAVPEGRSIPSTGRKVPTGPIVQENLGGKAAVRTFQDLLKNKDDEELYRFYLTSVLLKISPDGEHEIGQPAIYNQVSLSPDKSLLLLETINEPYSYAVPYPYFPKTTLVTDLSGTVVKELLRTPELIVATGYDTTSPYPRGFNWRPDKPATLYWVEAQDKGNPRENKVDYPDIVYQQEAPFTAPKQEVVRSRMRFGGILWCDDDFALMIERSMATRKMKMLKFKPCSNEDPKVVFDRSMDDAYSDLGSPYMIRNQYGKRVVYTNKSHNELLLISEGASPEGNMPYVSRYDIRSSKNTILWRCKAPYYESVYRIVDPKQPLIITVKQSQTEPANVFLKDLKRGKTTALTAFTNPYPMLEGMVKEKIRYKRADGVDLTANLYLPPGYDKERDGRLPVLMWAYPREYRSADDAAQVRGSEYTFTRINYGSPIFWVTQGYCVMDNVEMPIVGAQDTEPNDNFVEQLVMNAEAAVKVITDMGIGDPNRVAVGGHSYGAFMTANLLSHTKLFKAGIARSGAYNRTLTPFGFQAERRTYWEAPEVYHIMSPFMYADRLNGALLLIHGEMDNNSGTFPMQSERYFQALKGNKATTRYVVLPLESHGYAAKENILHMLYEQDAWLNTYVKQAK